MPGKPDHLGGPAAQVISRRGRRMRAAPPRTGDVNEAALRSVARDLVQRGEFQAISVAGIAERAGISRQGFYFYYQSKDELLGQLANELFSDSPQWGETPEDWRDPAKAMRGHVAAVIELWRENREIMRAAVEVGPRSPIVLKRWIEIVEGYAEFLVDLVVSATTIEALRDRAKAQRTILSILWMIERNCYVHFVHGSRESDDSLGERLGDIYIRAVGVH
jgi:AcrR family transcriptional regulator